MKIPHVTPREHINLLIIEAYNDNTAYIISKIQLNDENIKEIYNMKDRVLKALINIPNLSRAGTGQADLLYPLGGTIYKSDKDLYNDKDNGEKDKFKLNLNQNKYNELMNTGKTKIIDSPQDHNGPEISFTQRVTNANKKAKEIIDSCDEKIKEYEKMNRIDTSDLDKKGINKELNISEHNDYYIEKGILYYRGVMDEFGRILVKKFKSKEKFKEIVDKLEHKVYFFSSSKYIQDSKIRYQFKRYEKVINDEEIETNNEDFNKIIELIGLLT